MFTEGRITEVLQKSLGSYAYTDEVLGASSIRVLSNADFNEIGGTLAIYGHAAPYAYTLGSDANEDYSILNVVPNLTAAVGAGDPVSVDPEISVKYAYVETLTSETDMPGETIEAVFVHSLQPQVEVGTRLTGQGEWAIISDDFGPEKVIVDLKATNSYVYTGSLSGVLEVPTDGSPPPSSPTPVLTPWGVNGLRWDVDTVANLDPSRFRIYAAPATDVVVTIDAAHLVGDTDQEEGYFQFIDGDPLIPVSAGSDGEIPEYIAVAIQYDADGDAPVGGTSVPVAPRRMTQEEFAVGIVYAGRVQTIQLDSGVVDAALIIGNEIATAEAGNDRVGFNTDGFFSEDAVGARAVDIPNTGSPMFKGNAQLDSATFQNGFEARGKAIIATGGSIDLASSQSDPGAAPTAWTWRDTVALATAAKPSAGTYPAPIQSTHSGCTSPVWDAANNRWLIGALWKISSTQYRLYIYQDVSPFGDGTWVGTDAVFGTATDWSFMHAFIHGTRLVVGMVAGAGGNWFPSGFLLSDLTTMETRNGAFGTAITNADGMTVGSDGTDLIFAKIAPTAATHEGVTMAINEIYAHRRPVTINAGSLTNGFVLGAIAQSWDLNQYVTNHVGGTRKLKSILCARAGATVQFDYSSVVAFKSLTSNVATLETVEPHSVSVGDSITVAGVDATFNGTYTITATTKSSFSYAKVAANVTRVASGGTTVWAASHVIVVSTDASNSIGGFSIPHCAFTVSDAAGPTNAVFRNGWYGGTVGLAWKPNDGYLWGYDPVNFRMEKQHHNKQGGYWNISYTYTDDNATGSRHESLRSPEFRMGGWGRSKTTIQSGAIPTAGGVDDPGGVRFYIRHDSAPNTPARSWRVGAGNGFVAAALGGSASIVLDDVFPFNTDAPAYSVDTGLTQAPTTNSFPIGTAGLVQSVGDAGGRGVASLNGLGFGEIPGLKMRRYKKAASGAQTLTTGVTTLITEGATASPDDGSWSYSAGTFTCIKPGRYLVTGSVCFVGNATGNRHTTLTKNGTEFAGQSGSTSNAVQYTQSCSNEEDFAVGDTVTMTARHQAGANLNTVPANTWVNFTRIGY